MYGGGEVIIGHVTVKSYISVSPQMTRVTYITISIKVYFFRTDISRRYENLLSLPNVCLNGNYNVTATFL